MRELKQVTEELVVLVEKMMSEYKSRRESGEKGDFYTEVKPFADEVKEKNDAWKELSMNWIKEYKPKHIHLPQVLNTFDNIEMLSVHCFFPESSYNRFISHYQSVSYVLLTQNDFLNEK